MAFLPVTMEEVRALGKDSVDFVIVTGDAYCDHPSFGTAIIGRVLEDAGYTVGIISQPAWRDCSELRRFGRPRLAFMINSGNIDSMVAHYTSSKKRRSEDAYTPGGKAGKRPDRAVVVYSKLARQAYPDVPVIIGGLEASLRRFAHYDYWSDSVRPSILVESGADMLSYGMGEKQTVEIADRLNAGEPVSSMIDIKGTCVLVPVREYVPGKSAQCPSYEQVCSSKRDYALSCRIQQDEHDAVRGKRIIQRHGDNILICNPPMPPLSTEELDKVYELPYERRAHPSYDALGGVPGMKEIEFSIIHNRGCFGACAFCSLAFHQGRMITSRSIESVVREAERLTKMPGFKGYIHDVGGPTANFRRPSCRKQLESGLCKGKRCLAPKPCPNIEVDHSEYLELLQRLRKIPGVKKVFVRSGVRFDYLMLDKDDSFFRELVEHHVSGQLKVAPEHCSAHVLDCMGKPRFEVYKAFAKKYYALCKELKKDQYLVPYLMSSHPGSTVSDAIELALFLKKEHMHPEQVQDFYPTPGTIATCMFYTELDPYTLQPVYVPKTPEQKAEQRALLQYFMPENRKTVERVLRRAGRSDLIGTGENCLVRPSAPNSPNRPKPQTNRYSRPKTGNNKNRNGRKGK